MDGGTTEPEIDSYCETEDGKSIDQEEHFRESRGSQAYERLSSLRTSISGILEKSGITVLPAEEWWKPVPWLRGGEACLAGLEGTTIRVLDAFFFEEL